MSTAIRSVFTASVAMAGAGVMAVHPIAPSVDLQLPRLESMAVQLANTTAPAFGALPYQAGINTIGNLMALVPILIGGADQCEVCLGPTSTPPSDYTGFGAIGIAAGLLGSPVVFFNTLTGGGDFGAALGEAALAITTPITNTNLVLAAPRESGGFDFEATVNRTLTALNDTIAGLVAIGSAALVAGPSLVIGGVVAGLQAFAAALAAGDDLKTAVDVGLAPMQAGLEAAVTGVVTATHDARVQVYSDLTTLTPTLTADRTAAPAAAAAAASDAPAPASVRPTARKASPAAAAPRAAAVANPGTAVSRAAREAVASATGTGVGKAVKSAVGAPRHAR